MKEQMMTSVTKTLKTSDQRKTDRFLTKFALKITTKSAVFFPIALLPSLPENSREIPAKSAHFSSILSLKIPRNLTFFPRTIRSPVHCIHKKGNAYYPSEFDCIRLFLSLVCDFLFVVLLKPFSQLFHLLSLNN